MTTRKTRIVALATVLAASTLLGGTYALVNFQQELLNEFEGKSIAGLRLHDDFDATAAKALTTAGQVNKDVYVENYGQYEQFVRVRLLEYMERGYGEYGAQGANTSLIASATKADPATWRVHRLESVAGDPDPFHEYYSLSLGGQKYYLPTDNQTDYLEDADEGKKVDNQLDYTNADPDHRLPAGWAGADHTDVYTPTDVGYKADGTDPEKALPHNTHGAGVAQTPAATVITMAQWLADKTQVNVWVYDTDGWAYWIASTADSQPSGLKEGMVTGLLLNQVTLDRVPESDTWYYGIQAELESITADDWDGFETDGRTITDDAKTLLHAIGLNQKPKLTDAAAGTHTGTARAASVGVTPEIPIQPFELPVADWFEDPEGDALSFDITEDADGAAVIEDGTFKFTPAASDGGKTRTFTVRVKDARDESDGVTITVTVAATPTSYAFGVTNLAAGTQFTASGYDWIIVYVSGTKASVLAKNIVASRAFDTGTPGNGTNLWRNADIRQWLNGNDATDPQTSNKAAGDGFLQSLDDELEQRVQLSKIYTQSPSLSSTYTWTEDYVFLLSQEEVLGTGPTGFSTTNTWPIANSATLFAPYKVATDTGGVAGPWTLRTPTTATGSTNNYTAWVGADGVASSGYAQITRGIRPAMTVELGV